MKSKNVLWHGGQVSTADRAGLLGQRGCVVWLTGLSGSGKSTLARVLESRLVAAGRACYVLDGDNIRHGLNRDLGFSPADRRENIRRVGEVAALLADAGLIAITAFISPYRAGRKLARQACGESTFVEVFLNASLGVCQARDPKGLYAKAEAGKVRRFTGIAAPYERPVRPEIVLDTGDRSVEDCAETILAYMKAARVMQHGHPARV
jgi:adenylylsulfate kinase